MREIEREEKAEVEGRMKEKRREGVRGTHQTGYRAVCEAVSLTQSVSASSGCDLVYVRVISLWCWILDQGKGTFLVFWHFSRG